MFLMVKFPLNFDKAAVISVPDSLSKKNKKYSADQSKRLMLSFMCPVIQRIQVQSEFLINIQAIKLDNNIS